MASLISAEFVAKENVFYENGQPNNDLGGHILTHGYNSAVIECKRILGTTRYDEVVALGDSDDLFNTLKTVLARFAFYHAFPRLNLRPTSAGGFIRATGTLEDRNDIMSFREMKAYRNQVFRDARTLCRTLHTDTDLQPYGSGPSSEPVYVI